MSQHIVKLKHHRNVLYIIVTVLLVLQIGSSLWMSFQLEDIKQNQQELIAETNDKISDIQKETRFTAQELVKEINNQRDELQTALTEQNEKLDLQIDKLKAEQADFSGVIDRVIPAVVSIITDKAAASGFVINSNGYVITNHHVIDGANSVHIITSSNKQYSARILGSDPSVDIALLKVDGVILDEIEMANSEDVSIGDKVIAIGNPLGLSFSVTEGIVSAVHRNGPSGKSIYVQTDVTLNPGNSGGPLINKEGKVVGVNDFKIGGAEGLGFAIESDAVKEVVSRFTNQSLFNA